MTVRVNSLIFRLSYNLIFPLLPYLCHWKVWRADKNLVIWKPSTKIRSLFWFIEYTVFVIYNDSTFKKLKSKQHQRLRSKCGKMFLHLRLSLTLIWQRHSNIFALLFNLFIFYMKKISNKSCFYFSNSRVQICKHRDTDRRFAHCSVSGWLLVTSNCPGQIWDKQ